MNNPNVLIPYDDFIKIEEKAAKTDMVLKLLGTEFPDNTCQLIAIKSVLGYTEPETPADTEPETPENTEGNEETNPDNTTEGGESNEGTEPDNTPEGGEGSDPENTPAGNEGTEPADPNGE